MSDSPHNPASVLHVLSDPPLDGPTNMARDEVLLHDLSLSPIALRLYAWASPTISLGYFQPIDAVAKLPEPLRDLPVVRRQTGGGAILHDQEITYSLALSGDQPLARAGPDVLYDLVHAIWLELFAEAGVEAERAPDHFPMPSPRSGPFFCFEKPARGDLTLGGAKIVGSAQRRIPALPIDDSGPSPRANTHAGRVLQHGSIIYAQRFDDHPGGRVEQIIEPTSAWVNELRAAFIARMARGLACAVNQIEWTAAQRVQAETYRARYADDAFTRRR